MKVIQYLTSKRKVFTILNLGFTFFLLSIYNSTNLGLLLSFISNSLGLWKDLKGLWNK